MPSRVAIIGAGAAGCAAAHRLARAGHEVVVFERAAAVGGRTTSWRKDGHVVDSGAGFFTNFYPTLHRLAGEVGLADSIATIPRKTALVHRGVVGGLTVGSVPSFLSYPFAGAAAKLRMGVATAAAAVRHRGLDLSRPATLAALDDQTVHEDAAHRVGEEAYQFFVRPGIEPFWYFSCDEVSRALSVALLSRAATARFYTLAGGMDTLCHALVAGLDVRTATAVDAVERHRDGNRDRFVVRTASAAESFDGVVVATTATVAARLVAAVPDIAPATRAFVESQRYVANVHAAFVTGPLPALHGRTALFPVGPEPTRVAALSFNGAKSQGAAPRDGELVSVFLTADESRRAAPLEDAALFAHAWTLARELWPELPAGAAPFRLVRRDEAIPVHAVGRYRQAAAVAAAQTQTTVPIVFAGDYLATATVDGALTTGLAAADALAACLGRPVLTPAGTEGDTLASRGVGPSIVRR